MIARIKRTLGRRFLLLLLPLGIIGILVAEAHPPELSIRNLGWAIPEAKLLPSGELVRHPDAGPDPFVSRPSWAHLPGLADRWELQQASSEVKRGDSVPLPPDDAVPRVVEREDGLEFVRVDYPDGSYYEGHLRRSYSATRDWFGVEFVSSAEPGVQQFVTDLDDENHPLITALGEDFELPFDEAPEILTEVDDDTTVYRSVYPRELYFHEALIEGEIVTFEVTGVKWQDFRPRDTVETGVFTPGERHPLVAGLLRRLHWIGTIVGGLGAVSFLVILAGVDQRSRSLAKRILPSPAGQMLVERWLKRSRYFRFIGATVGALLYVGRQLGDPININLVDLTFWMFVGVAIGGAAAELHLVRRRSNGSTLADLQQRSIIDYTTGRDRAAMIFVSATSCVLVLLRLTNVVSGSLLWSLAAAALVVAAYGFQRIVASRRRPAVPGPLRSADDVLRFLASTRGFGRPATAAALIAMAQAVWWDSAPGWVGWGPLVLVLTAIVWYASGSERKLPKLVENRLAT